MKKSSDAEFLYFDIMLPYKLHSNEQRSKYVHTMQIVELQLIEVAAGLLKAVCLTEYIFSFPEITLFTYTVRCELYQIGIITSATWETFHSKAFIIVYAANWSPAVYVM